MTIHEYLFGFGGCSELDRRARTSTYWEAVKEYVDKHGSDNMVNLPQCDKDYLFEVKDNLQKKYK